MSDRDRYPRTRRELIEFRREQARRNAERRRREEEEEYKRTVRQRRDARAAAPRFFPGIEQQNPFYGLPRMQESFVDALRRNAVFIPVGGEMLLNPIGFGLASRYDPIVSYNMNLLRGGVNEGANCFLSDNGSLVIPLSNLYNFRVYVFLYVLNFFVKTFGQLRRQGTFTVFMKEGQREPSDRPSGVNLGSFQTLRISLAGIIDVFDAILIRFENILMGWDNNLVSDGVRETAAHTFTEESGDRIIIYNPKSSAVYYLRLYAVPGNLYQPAGRWSAKVEQVLNSSLSKCPLLTFSNTEDDLCLFYCLTLGIAMIEDPNLPKNYLQKVNDVSKATVACVNPDVTPFAFFVYMKGLKEYKNIKDRFGFSLSLQEFCRVFKEVEDDILPEKINTSGSEIKCRFCVDVYLMNTQKSTRIYPAYMSLREAQFRISVLFVITKEVCHCFLIRDLKTLFRETQGKLFFTCSGCHQAFFTKSQLMTHSCEKKKRESDCSPNVAGYKFVEGEPRTCCVKCRLEFKEERGDDFAYEYHKKHCFMKGRRGFRHVKLLEPGTNFLEQDVSAEDDEKVYVYFADFECCIPPSDDSSRHEFMSYGLYDVEGGSYSHGTSLEEFMRTLDMRACENKKSIVYFHNGMNYDAFFIIRYYLEEKEKKDSWWNKWSMKLLMRNSSQLQSVTFTCRLHPVGGPKAGVVHTLTIGDTCKFLTMSLERIVESVRKDSMDENMKSFPLFFMNFKEKYSSVSYEEINNVLHKNLFPYKFFTSPSRLHVSMEDFKKVFKPREENLRYFADGVSVTDLEKNFPTFSHIIQVFDMKTAEDYHNLYLMCDVMEITDVFISAYRTLKESHKICLTDYIGMPSATWHAFLKLTPGLKLQLYNYTFFAEFFSSMTRGGVTSAPLRYAKSDENHSIVYLDVNGLYPFVMMKYPYPLGDFKLHKKFPPECYENPNKYFHDVILEEFKDNNRSACFCVDLSYHDEVEAEACDQFPLAPNHELIKDEFFDTNGDMYEFMKQWSEANDGAQPSSFRGLVGTLYPKKEYGVHLRLLKFYLDHGMKIDKIHFYVSFTESFYLHNYVKKNIDIRNTRTDPLGKMVYKLLGNALYGKTFESPFNHGNYVVVNNQESLAGMIEEGNVASITQIDDKHSIVQVDGEEVILNKPTYIGACVTEMAKLHMYKLFYDKLQRLFPNTELVYTDTDSFIVRIPHPKGVNVIEVLKNTPLGKKKEPLIGSEGGKIKSETGDEVIDEVIALRSKVYAYRLKDGHIGKRAKGTTAAAQDTQLDWDTYKAVLEELKGVYTNNLQFIKDRFTVATGYVKKLSLSANDAKRYICPDGIHTLAWGNPKIPHLNKQVASEAPTLPGSPALPETDSLAQLFDDITNYNATEVPPPSPIEIDSDLSSHSFLSVEEPSKKKTHVFIDISSDED